MLAKAMSRRGKEEQAGAPRCLARKRMLSENTVESGFGRPIGIRALQAPPRSGGLGWDDREAVPLPCLLELRTSYKINEGYRALCGGPGCRLARPGVKPGEFVHVTWGRERASFGPSEALVKRGRGWGSRSLVTSWRVLTGFLGDPCAWHNLKLLRPAGSKWYTLRSL